MGLSRGNFTVAPLEKLGVLFSEVFGKGTIFESVG